MHSGRANEQHTQSARRALFVINGRGNTFWAHRFHSIEPCVVQTLVKAIDHQIERIVKWSIPKQTSYKYVMEDESQQPKAHTICLVWDEKYFEQHATQK